MFKKILVANRGEIACRVFRTAKRMGIATVAVYSDADAGALHVREADEAARIGPAPAAQSYLSIEAILAAARATGAEAVHPGYGFLSERADFPRALEAAGIVFIGPNAAAIDAMGDKIASKRAAAAAGVSTVPGFLGIIESTEQAVRIAEEIGYPVMLKASAGGGGKGMRIARSAAEVAEGLARARSEAGASFGDDRVFVERFVENARHIEIQVLGDRHGDVVHLGERECSIQRRNQKIVEESPSPLLDAATRAAMGAQAVALAKAVGYDSAGTVEFVAGQDKSFFFLEMNTRLQVEHPVTELVTGIDLVEEMIRIAAGEPLRLRQEDVRQSGWAVETRIYAEDPATGFLPSTGRLVGYRPPAAGEADGVTVRIDSGVEEGSEVSRFYDPMIAKLITHAPTRHAAIEAQGGALDAFFIDGVRTNTAFLAGLMRNARWRAGRLSTAFLEEEFSAGFADASPDEATARVLACVAAAMEDLLETRRRLSFLPLKGGDRTRAASREGVFAGGRDPHPDGSAVSASPLQGEEKSVSAEPQIVRLAGRELSGAVERTESGWRIHLDGTSHEVASQWRPGDPVWTGTIDGEKIAVQARPILSGFALTHAGATAETFVFGERTAAFARRMRSAAAGEGDRALRTPMPALVVSVAVTAGQAVRKGDPIAVLEAMKMEHVLKAPRDGLVAAVHASPGQTLAMAALVAEIE